MIGSGASILDFDLANLDSKAEFHIALNNAIFLPFKLKFHSYELVSNAWYSEAMSERHEEILSEADLDFLCRLAIDLRDLKRYPASLLMS